MTGSSSGSGYSLGGVYATQRPYSSQGTSPNVLASFARSQRLHQQLLADAEKKNKAQSDTIMARAGASGGTGNEYAVTAEQRRKRILTGPGPKPISPGPQPFRPTFIRETEGYKQMQRNAEEYQHHYQREFNRFEIARSGNRGIRSSGITRDEYARGKAGLFLDKIAGPAHRSPRFGVLPNAPTVDQLQYHLTGRRIDFASDDRNQQAYNNALNNWNQKVSIHQVQQREWETNNDQYQKDISLQRQEIEAYSQSEDQANRSASAARYGSAIEGGVGFGATSTAPGLVSLDRDETVWL